MILKISLEKNCPKMINTIVLDLMDIVKTTHWRPKTISTEGWFLHWTWLWANLCSTSKTTTWTRTVVLFNTEYQQMRPTEFMHQKRSIKSLVNRTIHAQKLKIKHIEERTASKSVSVIMWMMFTTVHCTLGTTPPKKQSVSKTWQYKVHGEIHLWSRVKLFAHKNAFQQTGMWLLYLEKNTLIAALL